MTTKREIEAYRKRLSKITSAMDLRGECLNAVVSFFGEDSNTIVTGTLVGFRLYPEMGLFGELVKCDLTVCTACVGQKANCPDPVTHSGLYARAPLMAIRNEDGAAEVLAALVEERWS